MVGLICQMVDSLTEDQIAARIGTAVSTAGGSPLADANKVMQDAARLRNDPNATDIHPQARGYLEGDPAAMEYVNNQLKRGGK